MYVYIREYCLLIYVHIYDILISSREERRNADGQKNRQADKSGSSTYSACTRNRNSHSSNQNDYREYLIKQGEGNLPSIKI